MFENIDWAQFSPGIAVGLFVGLIITSLVWFRGIMSARGMRRQKEGELGALRKELDRLQEHLHTQMKITSKGNDKLEREAEDLKKVNENLRIENSSLRQKAGRQELRQFEVYERAISKMNGRAPGFGPAWQSALAESEAEQQEAESGVVGFVRKIFRGSSTIEAPALEMHSSANGSHKPDKEESEH